VPTFNRRQFVGTVAASLSASAQAQQPETDLVLWYDKPAEKWTDALPLGNGGLGAMVFGGLEDELLQLNEDTLWSGGPRDWNNPDAKEASGGGAATGSPREELRRSGSGLQENAGSV
jgi:alpha-L-fucosidase 2